ncbi:MAG: type II toxin-antitoxin system VapC family toxin [Caldilinea sp.]|nr:type II toxin-antitoxin system VapC family toxin [Caldilinea sp.]MDW8442320.1 type II toxin-antitoxin system VapC family toxin [Caldilineaceae bacterium]
MIVLDTAALLYLLFQRERLSGVAMQAISTADALLLSSISIWEIAVKVKKKKLVLPMSPRELTSRLHGVDRVRFAAVSDEIWLTAADLEWSHQDPADRVIVATAQQWRCHLVTSDTVIRAYYPLSIW